MAITRAQQAKQLLAQGGRIGLKGGADAATESFAKSYDRAVGNAPGTTKGRKDPEGGFDLGGGQGPTFDGAPATTVTGDEARKAKEKIKFAQSLRNDKRRRERRKRALEKQKLFKTISLRDKLMLDPTIRTLDDNLVDVGAIDDQGFTIGGVKVPSFITGAASAFTVDPSTKYFDEDSIREIGSVLSKSKTGITKSQADTLADIREDIEMRDRILDPNDTVTQSEFDEYINRNKIEDIGGEGGIQDPCKGPNPPAYCFIGQNADDNMEAAVTRNLSGLTPRIGGSIFNFDNMADGGIAGMDREAFLLGGIAKGLKKAVRGVKKLAKSPIGKAALAFGAYKLASPLFGKGTFFGTGFNPLKDATKIGPMSSGLGKFLSKYGLTDFVTGDLTGLGKGVFGLGIPMALSAFTSKPEDGKFDLASYYADNKLDPNAPLNKRIAGSEFDFYGGQKAADGGRIGYDEAGAVMSKEDMEKMAKSPLYKGFKTMYGVSPDMARDNKEYEGKFKQFEQLFKKGYQEGGDVEPVAKKTMPLLDMGGKEKDYRETGGFVDMGRMERADDVPARLSKNEFVFTADAVRNAGEGDIDKGAEVMYNMMKNLEAGGEVSEESQGLKGAREMFQTSQRLGEVI